MSSRYKATEREKGILEHYFDLYMEGDKRGAKREELRNECLAKLVDLGDDKGAHWTETNVRQWFTNNKKRMAKGKQQPASPAPPPAALSNLPAIVKQGEISALQMEQRRILLEMQQTGKLPPPSPVRPAPVREPVNQSATRKANTETTKNVEFDGRGIIVVPGQEIEFNVLEGPSRIEIQVNPEEGRPISRTLSRTMSSGYSILDKIIQQDTQSKKIEEPEIQIEKPLTDVEKNSNSKMALIMHQKKYHNNIDQAADIKATHPEVSRNYQRQLEEYYVKTLESFKSLEIAIPVCMNQLAVNVKAPLDSNIRRQVSCTTQIYNGCNDYDYSKGADPKAVGSFVRVSEARIPPDVSESVQAMYQGKYETRTVESHETVKLCEVLNDNIFIVAKEEESWVLKNSGTSIRLECTEAPSAMMCEERRNIVWLHCGDRILGFEGSTLNHIDTLCVGCTAETSCLAVWGEKIVAAIGTDLYSWPASAAADEQVDLVQGREPRELGFKVELEKITSMATTGNYIVIADCDYPVAHVYRLDQKDSDVWTRLISHSMGITCLRCLGESQVFTGSKDRLSYLWDLETGKCSFLFYRHGNTVIDFECKKLTDSNETLFFSAGLDSVRAWDICHKQFMFDIRAGEGLTPVKVRFFPDQKTLVIVAEGSERKEIQKIVF